MSEGERERERERETLNRAWQMVRETCNLQQGMFTQTASSLFNSLSSQEMGLSEHRSPLCSLSSSNTIIT